MTLNGGVFHVFVLHIAKGQAALYYYQMVHKGKHKLVYLDVYLPDARD